MPDVTTIRVILPTPLMTFVKVVIPDPIVTAIRVQGINTSASPVGNTLQIGPYARLRAITGGPPNGVALDIYDTGSSSWVEQWEYTQ